MTATMGPPPPKNPAATDEAAAEPSTSVSAKETATDPPLSENPNLSEPEPEPEPESEPSENHHQEPELNSNPSDVTENHAQSSNSTDNSTNDAAADAEKKLERRNRNAAVPYEIPPWSGPPGHHFSFEVLKDGAIVDQFDVNKKGAYMFGRVDLCDFVLDHPTISRFHAVLQYKSNGGVYLFDLGSTHGTSINKSQVKKRVYVDLRVGDVIRFGQSTRLYIFQGPSDLMPPEADLKNLRKAKVRLDRQDMEASLLRARVEASRADGISWGMGEDAVEENEEDVEEITWQTYKGQLTDKQEKTREKVIKRLEKIGHMKKEIDAIRAKDIAQGGLSQGQQTQIARNEQRIAQIMEELENLEETLNESIQESLGARAGKSSRGKKKGPMEEDEDYMSDDDDFYDRTKKPSKNKSGENKSVETADSLLDKKDTLIKQIEDKEKLILAEDNKPAEINEATETGDALDSYMSAVSSQLVTDSKEKLQKDKSVLQSELDRILYLLKIADPAGEAARKREFKAQNPQIIVKRKPSPQNNKKIGASSAKTQNPAPEDGPSVDQEKPTVDNAKSEPDMKKEEPELINDETEATVYTVAKPQWLGAVEDRQKKPEITQAVPVDATTQDTIDIEFVDYKDRGKIVNKIDSLSGEQGIEDAAPGLIIRKRKQIEKSKADEVKESEETNNGSEFKAEDAVALLLKHSRGYHVLEDEDRAVTSEGVMIENEVKKDGKKVKSSKKAKRVLGPERPSFLSEPDNSTWVPPEVNRAMDARR
ncbi:hypothetical protein CASFOL_026711 [Castilleja foliolosa]|uniref:FHA domain-containing protein n=1 Tax=Castilleja foliolosa TaxID=1961234 RepID=A0ABD3CIV5_9LAMI